ncbi:MAG: TonB-dependent receptor, partial [Cytophagales bacterium]
MKSFVLLFLTISLLSQAQITQTIKGQITDKESKYPLIGVTVAVIDVEPIIGAATDENGEFKLENVPLGRHTLKINYIGYKEQVMPNIVVSAGKQSIIDFALSENVTEIDEIVVKAEVDKTATNNDMTVVSARSFNLEEAQRYAGSLNDPSRMAANFAGVNGANDARNDIVIRGNSPLGLLWRLEGVEIPNPNHFGSLGSTGGPVSILNTNQLGKSDFMTSAFPANYGNATSGVFDLTLRRPNNEKREHILQVGFNGLEAGTEGYFTKKSKASYMINYRYSTLGVFQAIGVNFGTGAAIPQYQDLTFKVEIPTAKFGKFILFGMGGLSNIEFYDSKIDTTKTAENFYNDGTQDILFRSDLGVVGASHLYFINPNTSIKTIIVATASRQPVVIDTIIRPEIKLYRDYEGDFSTNRLSANISLNSKLNRKNTVNTGVNIDRIGFNLYDKFADTLLAGAPLVPLRNSSGANYLSQAWAQWQHKFNDRFTVNLGLHFQHYSINTKSLVFEPRLGIKYQLTTKSTINFGAGVHNQTQPIFMYYNTTRLANGSTSSFLSNKNLGFTNSNHFVLGYDNSFDKNWRLKAEVYYQFLTNVPIESNVSTFSMVNVGSDFNLPGNDFLVNKGTSTNYGAELTIERFFSNGFYLLGTGSVFQSKYKGSDGVERNTAYNGNYVFNALGGYEFKIGKKNTLSINLKGTYAGGRRYTPIDVAASLDQKRSIFIEEEAYTLQLPDYFRTDITLGFKREGKRITQQWLLQINNLTDNVNIFQRRYSITDNKIVDVPQQSRLIIPQYRIL